MPICLFEDDQIDGLYPLIHTRGVYQLRVGALSTQTRLPFFFPGEQLFLHVRNHLGEFMGRQTNLPVNRLPEDQGTLFVNGRMVTASEALLDRLNGAMEPGEPDRLFLQGDELIAAWIRNPGEDLVQNGLITASTFGGTPIEEVEGAMLLNRLWHIIDYLHPALLYDLETMIRIRPETETQETFVSPHATLLNPSDIYISRGVRIRAGALLDASNGPIVLERNAEIMEQSIVRGPLYLGEGSTLKARSEIEGSGIGPVCKVAGEVMDVVFQSYSNKAHQGFLGHSYLGSWCNMGAGSISSNLRNDYAMASLYNERVGVFEESHRQFLGVFMADHSKCGINSMFNTGSVIGVFCNIYGSGFIPRYVPSFSWGGPDDGFVPYRIEKALEVARRVFARRRLELSEEEALLLTRIYEEKPAGA